MTVIERQQIIERVYDLRDAEIRCAAAVMNQLDYFASLPEDEKRTNWQGRSMIAKRQLVSLFLIKRFDDYSQSSIDELLPKWEEKYGK